MTKSQGYKGQIFLILLIIVFSLNSLSQGLSPSLPIELKGIVIDKETPNPVAYVGIGIQGKPLGTLSDSAGHYGFFIGKENLGDSLLLSTVGYYSLKLAIRQINRKGDTTLLQRRHLQLPNLVVISKPADDYLSGRQEISRIIQVSLHNKKAPDQTIGSEMGMRIKVKRKAWVKDLNWYVSINNFKTIKFRVNIYSVKNDMPDTLICRRQILATVNDGKTGWIKIDLRPYEVIVNSDFIITLQWIGGTLYKKEVPLTMLPEALSFSKNQYVRMASQDKWKRMGFSLSYYATLSDYGN